MWGGIGEAEGRRELETPQTLETGDGVTKTVPRIILAAVLDSLESADPGARGPCGEGGE